MQVTVQRGDTLWSLAARHLGNGLRWPELYRVNEREIVREQQRYPEARRAMQGPNWIYPGTTLTLPTHR
jgi:nucleoid-associated protein YgaU